MRSLIDLVGRRRPAAEPSEPGHAGKAAGDSSGAEPPQPEQATLDRGAAGQATPAGEARPGAADGRAAGGGTSVPGRDSAGDPADGADGGAPGGSPDSPADDHGVDDDARRDVDGAPAGSPADDMDGDAPDDVDRRADDGADDGADGGADGGADDSADGGPDDSADDGADDGRAGDAKTGRKPADRARGRRRGLVRRPPVVLGIITVLLGGTAAWCADQADRVRTASGGGNVALTDVAATSEVKGVVTDAVNDIFSFDYADMGRTQQAADHVLTGDAVRQYDAMVAQVRAQAPRQKLVLTTTVTDSAVEMLQRGRARLLLFADQHSTRTVAKDTTYAAAMLAVDAVRRDGHWKISAIDTLTGRR